MPSCGVEFIRGYEMRLCGGLRDACSTISFISSGAASLGSVCVTGSRIELAYELYPVSYVYCFRRQERERWTEAIVRDELARPAEISEMFLKDWEQRQDANRKRHLKVQAIASVWRSTGTAPNITAKLKRRACTVTIFPFSILRV